MNRDVCMHFNPVDLPCAKCKEPPALRYIPADTAKCAGNPIKRECETCLRKLLPVHPDAHRQTYMGPWIIEDEPCPRRWVEDENHHH